MKTLLLLLLSCSSLIAQHKKEIHCKHFFYGYPYGAPASNDLIIRSLYALSNNDSSKMADWVMYKLDTSLINGSKKKRNWKKDPWLEEDETLEPSPRHGDYKAAHATIAVDRGHQVPLASVDGSPDWFESNYLSNITPQKSALNQGPWKNLEAKVRELVVRYQEVYVATGPLFERPMALLPEADEFHMVPSGYWKIIFVETKEEILTAAFIMDQNALRNDDFRTNVVHISEVESRCGLAFLWLLPEPDAQEIKSSSDITWLDF